jgi:hypothetical protein
MGVVGVGSSVAWRGRVMGSEEMSLLLGDRMGLCCGGLVSMGSFSMGGDCGLRSMDICSIYGKLLDCESTVARLRPRHDWSSVDEDDGDGNNDDGGVRP